MTSWRLPRAGAAALALVGTVFLPRLTSLGTTLTNDEVLWVGRARKFMVGIATLEPRLTFGEIHPGVTTMWLAGLADRFGSLAASQGAIALATGTLTLIATTLLVRIVGWRTGMLGGFILALDPFLIAHSRVVHTDALLALCMLITLMCFALARQTRSRWYLGLAGIGTSLAALSKFFGLFLFLPALVNILRGPWQGRRFRSVAAFVVPFALTILVLWPALLVPQTFLRHSAMLLMNLATQSDVGKGGGSTLYYPRAWFFRLTPVTTVAGAMGIISLALGSFKTALRPRAQGFWWSLIGSAVVFGGLLTISGQKGDRYFLFGVLVMDLFAGLGIAMLAQAFGRKHAGLMMMLFGGIAVVIMGFDVIRLHPYELAHINRFFPVREPLKLGLGEGLERAAAWVRTNADPRTTEIGTFYALVLSRWYPGFVDSLGHEYDSDRFRYVILYRSMFGRSQDGQESQYIRAYFMRGNCRHLVVVNGLPYVWIFDRLPLADGPAESDTLSQGFPPFPQCATTETTTT